MTACFADSSSDACYTSIAMSKSSSSSSDSSALALTESSPLEGLEDLCIQRFAGIANMRKAVKSQSDKLQAGDSNQQYLIFRPVTENDLAKIDQARDSIGKHTRMAHDTDTNSLIVKLMPSVGHEGAHRNFASLLIAKMIGMGMSALDIYSLGAARFAGRRSFKEGDSAFKPLTRQNENDWPTIVIESGLSESLRRLRADARWWLENSGGDVRIVVIISINKAQQTLLIERWERAPLAQTRPVTRAFNNPNTLIPTKMQEITISSNAVNGAPLVLGFQHIFLRQAIPPEADITYTAQDLLAWATQFWAGLR